MGTDALGDNIKAALDALPAADKLDRVEVMRAFGNEIEDWHISEPPGGPIDANNVDITDAGGRYTGTEVETALQEIAGAGRTSETVKQNQDDIDALEADLYSKHEADGDHKDNVIDDTHIDWGVGANQVSAVDVPIADAGNRITATQIEAALQEIVGAGRTAETIKGNADDILGHDHDADYLGITAKAADSSLLNDAVESVAAGNDTIVKRHASGFIYANFFHTVPDTYSTLPTKVCVEIGDDGFIRHGTQAAIRLFIGAGTGNGLDADLLDGSHAAAFSLSGHDHDAVDIPITDVGEYYTATDVEGALQEIGAGGGGGFSGDHADLTNVTANQHHAQSHNHDADYLGILAKAADSSKLNNAVESVAASLNTIVKRHSAGYIFANYFNTTPNDVSSGVTKVLVETGNDGYMRHGSGAAIRAFIGNPTVLGSGAVAQDHGAAATDQVINVCYGTGSPPAAAGTTIGTLFVKYTA